MSRPALARTQRKAVIFGASGQLGTAVFEKLRTGGSYSKILRPEWKEISPALGTGSEKLISAVFLRETGAFDVVVASGLTDPKAGSDDLLRSNFEFPKQLIEAVLADTKYKGTRILTLGSIHETIAELAAKNAYLASKAQLADWISNFSAEAPGRVLHLRLHTLYGGKPNPKMFLGQMIEALRAHSEFKMSSGDQLREYMHVEDFALAIVAIFSQEWNFGPVLELSSGEAVRLCDLAGAVFEAVGVPELLKIGALTAVGGENRDRKFKRTDVRFLPKTRPPVGNIIQWVRGEVVD